VTGQAAALERRLPRGAAHLALQVAIWIGFYAAYQVARGLADHGGRATAFANGEWIIEFERSLGALFEVGLQEAVARSELLIAATSMTYWLSQFAVVGFALLWVYFRAHERFYALRDRLIVANLIGLVGYVLVPTAPPRMFPGQGFEDTLAEHAAINHSSSLVAFASNPYAAMPSLHSVDALIVGLTLAAVVRSGWAKALWLAWAPWVWFTVIATGNHYWLDVVAGIAVAAVAFALVRRSRA
jgi:membrane-associated phospholipid phosphatase